MTISESISQWMTNFELSYIHVLRLYSLSALLLFLPLFINATPSFEYESQFIPAITSYQYKGSQLVMLTASLTLFTEALLDAHRDVKLASCRLMLLLSLMVPSALTLGSDTWSHRRQVQIFVCCFEWRNNLVFGALIGAIVEASSKHWKSKWIMSMVICLSLTCFHFWLWESFHSRTTLSSVFSAILNFIFLVSILWMAMHSLGIMFRTRKENLKVEDKYLVVFSLALAFNFCAKFITFIVYGTSSWADIAVGEILIFCGCDVLFGIVAFILTMRIERERGYMAKHMLDSKKSFVRYISHEIRTPLNIVFMGLQFLKSNQEKEECTVREFSNKGKNYHQTTLESQQCVADMHSACGSAIAILNDLLLFDKLEDGKLVLDKSQIEVGHFLRNSLSPFNAQAKEKSVEFIFDDRDHLPLQLENVLLEVDVNKMAQVIRNIISNAIKFSPIGGRVDVFVRRVRSGGIDFNQGNEGTIFPNEYANDKIRIEVRDLGPGISKANQMKLFKEVIQFDAQLLQSGGGSGLGMWISSGIVERHGGTIGVSSSGVNGEGCVFHVELNVYNWKPLTRLARTKMRKESICDDDTSSSCSTKSLLYPSSVQLSESDISPRLPFPLNYKGAKCFEDKSYNKLVEGETGDHPTRQWRALIVDDSKLNVKMAKRVLSTHFDELLECFDGSEAIDLVRESLSLPNGAIDVIFMDSQMTVVHGPEAATKIRSMGYTGTIVAVSGNILDEDVSKFKKCGADAFVSKPLQLSKIEEILAAVGVIKKNQ